MSAVPGNDPIKPDLTSWQASFGEAYYRPTILRAIDAMELPVTMTSHDEDQDPVEWGWNAAVAAIRSLFEDTP